MKSRQQKVDLLLNSYSPVESLMNLSKIIVWQTVGAVAGNLAGRLATFSKQGFGPWANMGIGMVGAVVGGLLFGLPGIDFGLGEIKFTVEDLVSAFLGSLSCIAAVWVVRKFRKPETLKV